VTAENYASDGECVAEAVASQSAAKSQWEFAQEGSQLRAHTGQGALCS